MCAAKKPVRISFVLGALLAASVATSAQDLEIVLQEGDQVLSQGTIKRIPRMSITNGGFYFANVDTNFTSNQEDSAILLNGFLTVPENAPLPAPAGLAIDAFLTVDSNQSGFLGMILDMRGPGVVSSNDLGVFWNTSILGREGSLTTADNVFGIPLDPASIYFKLNQVQINDSNELLLLCEIDDPSIGSRTQREFALTKFKTDGLGAVLSEEVLLMEGFPLLATGENVNSVGVNNSPNSIVLNNAGDWMTVCRAGNQNARDSIILLNGAVLAREGDIGADGVRVWGDLNTAKMDMNDFGDTLFTALLSGGGPSNGLLVLNNEIFMQEGTTFPAIAPHAIATYGASPPVFITNSGDVYWHGTTSNPDNSRDQYYFRNQEIILRENDTIEGTPAVLMWQAEYAYDVSPSGRFFIGKVVLLGNITTLFMADYGALVPIPGSSTNAGTLTKVSGEAQLDNSFTLALDNAPGIGTLPMIFWSLAPAIAGSPTGINTKFGELLISPAAGNFLSQSTGTPYAGVPAPITIDIPNDPVLYGIKVWGQGAFWDMAGTFGGPAFSLTNAYRVEVGL